MEVRKLNRHLLFWIQPAWRSQKMPLPFIGKYPKLRYFPKCVQFFQNVPNFPEISRSIKLHSYANRGLNMLIEAWMTSNIYEKWLRDTDCWFSAAKRKALPIVDNCTPLCFSSSTSIHVKYFNEILLHFYSQWTWA